MYDKQIWCILFFQTGTLEPLNTEITYGDVGKAWIGFIVYSHQMVIDSYTFIHNLYTNFIYKADLYTNPLI